MTSRDAILTSLRREFVANPRERLAEMSELVESLTTNPEPGQLADLGRHFHSLAGLGGTYGFPIVTSLSFEAEEVCNRDTVSPASVEQLAAIITKLASEIENHPDNE